MNQYNDFIDNMLCGIQERNVLVQEYTELTNSNEVEIEVDNIHELEDVEHVVYKKFDKISELMVKLEKKSLWIYDTLNKDSTLVSNFNLLYELIGNEEFEKCAIVRYNITKSLKRKNITF